MKEVFGDTYYFLALVNPKDKAHERAVGAARDRTRRLITTTWVLAEVGNALANLSNRDRFPALIDLLKDDPRAFVIPPSQEQFEAGLELFRKRSDKEWSITDCVSFVAMDERGISEALTGDRHFEQAGFKPLLK